MSKTTTTKTFVDPRTGAIRVTNDPKKAQAQRGERETTKLPATTTGEKNKYAR